jgi:beta-lactamase regulating signal transducer with metallopeptidase domain
MKTMKNIKQAIVAGIFVLGIALTAVPALTQPAYAQVNPQEQACKGTGGTWNGTTCTGNTTTDDLPTVITNIVNVLLYIIGAVGVVMVVIGGIMYTTSAGDAAAVTKAKNTILYAVIGLVVAFLAYAIVNWVIGSLV